MKSTDDGAKLASLLHDMRPHTSTIKGYALLLKRDLPVGLPSDLYDYVEKIIEASNSLIELGNGYAAAGRE